MDFYKNLDREKRNEIPKLDGVEFPTLIKEEKWIERDFSEKKNFKQLKG